MRRIITLILTLLISCSYAETVQSPNADNLCPCTSTTASPVNGLTEHLIPTAGDVAIVEAFSTDVADFIKVKIVPNDDDKAIFNITNSLNLMEYDWFLINNKCELVANLVYVELICTCGEVWYEADVRFAPNWKSGGTFYLVWVE